MVIQASSRALALFCLLSVAVNAQQGAMRYKSSLWEKVHSRKGTVEAAEALLQLARLTPEPGRRRLLEQVVREYPHTLQGLTATRYLIDMRNLPLESRLSAFDALQESSGGSTWESARGRVAPLPLRTVPWLSRSQQANFLSDIYRDRASVLADAGRRVEALEIYRYLRVQFGATDAGEAGFRHFGRGGWYQDKSPPRLSVLSPEPDQLVLGPPEVCIEVHDGDFTESQCELESLRLRLDGLDVTRSTKRSHYIDISEAPGLTFERIEFRWLGQKRLRPGPHRLDVEIRDRAGNPTARSWTFFSVYKDAASPIAGLLEKGPDEAALEWLKKKPERAWGCVVKTFGESSELPLWGAILYDRSATARWLVEQGVPANAGGYDGFSRAAWAGQLELVKAIVERGARADKQSGLAAAATGGQKEVVRYLLQVGAYPPQGATADRPLLHQVAEGGHGPVLALLLPFFPDHNTRDSAGRTALHCATSATAVEALLGAGFDPNARDNAGRTPLQAAGGEGARPEIRDLLLRAGSLP